MSKEKAIVIAVTHYKFADKETNEIREGGHLHYVSDYAFDEEERRGMLPVKMAIKTNIWDSIGHEMFPAVCELDFRNVPDGKGKPVPTLVEVFYSYSIDLDQHLTNTPKKNAS